MGIETIGYIASVFCVMGFIGSNMKVIRLCSLAACILWMIYGVILSAPSIIIMNLTLGIIQTVKLIQKK